MFVLDGKVWGSGNQPVTQRENNNKERRKRGLHSKPEFPMGGSGNTENPTTKKKKS